MVRWLAEAQPQVETVDTWNAESNDHMIEVNAALADPKMRARLADLGGTPLPGSPAEFGQLIADETEKWGKVIKFAGIQPQ